MILILAPFGSVPGRSPLRSGGFHSLPELIAALEKYLLQENKEPNPSIWTAQAKDIQDKVTRARAKLNRRKRNAH